MVRFICRPDFLSRVHQSEHPSALLLNRSSVKHMISRIRRDSTTFERYQHNRDLVSLLNMFACRDRELPPGWESKKDRNGKVCTYLATYLRRGWSQRQTPMNECLFQMFFIDHTAKTTTFMDPRLPNDLPLLPPDLVTTPTGGTGATPGGLSPSPLLAPNDPNSPLLPPPPPRHHRHSLTPPPLPGIPSGASSGGRSHSLTPPPNVVGARSPSFSGGSGGTSGGGGGSFGNSLAPPSSRRRSRSVGDEELHQSAR